MTRLLLILGITMIVSAIFTAIFLNSSGARCLPPSALGVTVTPSEEVLGIGRFRGSANDLKILDALLAAAATVSPAPNRIPKIVTSDPRQYCRATETLLFVEIGATILITLAVSFWNTRRG
jgi:hypothetical protein